MQNGRGRGAAGTRKKAPGHREQRRLKKRSPPEVFVRVPQLALQPHEQAPSEPLDGRGRIRFAVSGCEENVAATAGVRVGFLLWRLSLTLSARWEAA